MYLRTQKVPNTSKFWDKDVSKRPEFPELRPKFERWPMLGAWRQQHSSARKVGTIQRAVAKSYDNDNAISAAVGSEADPVV